MKKTRTRSAYVSLTVELELPRNESMPAAALGLHLAGAAYAIRCGEVPPEFCREAAAAALRALHAALDKKGPRRTATNQTARMADSCYRRADGAITKKQAISHAIKLSGLRPANKYTFDRVRQALQRLRDVRNSEKTVTRKGSKEQ